MERKGPHKSMHCKFCKPPGAPLMDKSSVAQLETKTKLHLAHQTADLQVFDVFDEPGVVEAESEACICQLEGYTPCPKCAPDKTKPPTKKKVCDCPPGSKPHPNMAGLFTSEEKKKKKRDENPEFWWEKYDREHDEMVKETWAAYLAQRKEDKKFTRQQERQLMKLASVVKPKWFQRLSCQQTIYLEYLATAIRLDLDENIIERTFFVLSGIGLYPRPKRKMLEKCLRYCHYNTIHFLEQLSVVIQEEDVFHERYKATKKHGAGIAWNDRIIMACICHLEFPKLLREIMERLPPLPRPKLLPQIPEPKFPKLPRRKYDSPYEEPLWRDRLNWIEKQKMDRINRARLHMDTKRVKIPALALQHRPSLIDARPAFLSQIEAAQSFRISKKPPKKKVRSFRRKAKPTFDSKVDVTAIAGIAPSEVSTTPKADSEEICVFLREERPRSESIPLEEEEEEREEEEEEGEMEEEEGEENEEEADAQAEELRVQFSQRLSATSPSLMGEDQVVEEEPLDEDDDIPFVTPPKTGSGVTVEEPCGPPLSSPAPPAPHYAEARKALGLANMELCFFDPNEIKSLDDEDYGERSVEEVDVEDQLTKVVKKLEELDAEKELEEGDLGGLRLKRKPRKGKKKKCKKRKKKRAKKTEDEEDGDLCDREPSFTSASKTPMFGDYIIGGLHDNNMTEDEEEEEEEEYEDEEEEEGEQESEDSSEICVCTPEKKEEEKSPKKKKKRSKKRKCKKRARESRKSSKDKSDAKRGKKSSKDAADSKERSKAGIRSLKENIDDSDEESEDVSDESKIFYGDVMPLLKNILKDLNDEGFISAGYEEIEEHPDIKQLIKHLQGEIVTKKYKMRLMVKWKASWRSREKDKSQRIPVPNLNIPQNRIEKATWDDKKWVTELVRRKEEEYFFNIAKSRADGAKDFYLTLFQEYFGNETFLKEYYSYMIPKREESIMKGLP